MSVPTISHGISAARIDCRIPWPIFEPTPVTRILCMPPELGLERADEPVDEVVARRPAELALRLREIEVPARRGLGVLRVDDARPRARHAHDRVGELARRRLGRR